MSRRSRTKPSGCSVGWARRRSGQYKLLLIFGHEVYVAADIRHDAARVSYDRARGVLRVVPHPDGETSIGAVNVAAVRCARDRDKRYSLYVDVPGDPGEVTTGVRWTATHAVVGGTLEVQLPGGVAALVATAAEAPPPPPAPVPDPPPPRPSPAVVVRPPTGRLVRRTDPAALRQESGGSMFGDPTPERSALGQGYTPGSGLMRPR